MPFYVSRRKDAEPSEFCRQLVVWGIGPTNFFRKVLGFAYVSYDLSTTIHFSADRQSELHREHNFLSRQTMAELKASAMSPPESPSSQISTNTANFPNSLQAEASFTERPTESTPPSRSFIRVKRLSPQDTPSLLYKYMWVDAVGNEFYTEPGVGAPPTIIDKAVGATKSRTCKAWIAEFNRNYEERLRVLRPEFWPNDDKQFRELLEYSFHTLYMSEELAGTCSH